MCRCSILQPTMALPGHDSFGTTVGALEAALAPILDRSTTQDHPPLFWRHHGQLASRAGVERTVRECMDNLALAGVDPAGKVILDAGCGFGISCVL